MHTHSTFSDGTCTPSEVVRLAAEAGLEAVALTDHDTVAGLPEARQAGERYGIRVVNGIEISVKAAVSVHMIGLGFPDDAALVEEAMRDIVSARAERNARVIERLQTLGYPITEEDVNQYAHGVPGRSHIARAMYEKGLIRSIKEAFATLLNRGMPAYVPRRELTPQEAIELIHRQGGRIFVAHLNQIRLPDDEKYEFLRALKDDGLDGIEGYYTEYTPEMGTLYREWAEKLGLRLSGGSDFHGANKEGHLVGVGDGDLRVPSALLAQILT